MSNLEKVRVPDIGEAKNVNVIEIFVKVGDTVAKDASLITLEGDKATMEVPSSVSGVVKKIAVKVGDKVSEGSVIVEVETDAAESRAPKVAPEKKSTPEPVKIQNVAVLSDEENEKDEDDETGDTHAGPGVRRLAREFGIDLAKIRGSGAKNRIVKEDLQRFVKERLSFDGENKNRALAPLPEIDFSKFGSIEKKSLSKIQKVAGAALHRNWVSIPHVTQFGEADITELESFRQHQKMVIEGHETKLTPLVFVMKAVVAALKEFPHFNASLDPNGEQLILKKYFHIGVAVDTPAGLVVPVIRDVDRKNLTTLAAELAQVSKKARDVGLGMTDMQGGCFTISSLGGIGGSAFTPIINAPEVAILGVSRTQTKPVYEEQTGEWRPRLMLPLSLSYDHRVIDGADAARFTVYLASRLTNIGTLLL